MVTPLHLRMRNTEVEKQHVLVALFRKANVKLAVDDATALQENESTRSESMETADEAAEMPERSS